MGKKSGAHSLHKLSALAIQRTKAAGRYADGGGLYLQVAPTGSKSWLFRFMLAGRPREMGLGPIADVDVDAARQAAKAARETLREGRDPLEERNAKRSAFLIATREAKTFEWCAEVYLREKKEPELTNAKHAAQWRSTLETYAFPKLGKMHMGDITVHHVYDALLPIWLTKNETASRVRQRIEAVWGWAKTKGYCAGDNPAAWRGALENLFPSPSKVQEEEHHPSLPYDKAAAFVVALHAIQENNRKYRRSISPAMALEFTVLTVQRTNPIITAEWDEVDFEKRVWTSPAEHMKGQFPMRVPLVPRAIEILEIMRAQRHADCALIFQHTGRGLHNTSMLNVVENMDERQPGVWVDPQLDNRRITPHGFRSTFTDWAAETTEHEFKAYDKALAHAEKNQTVAAYLRGDMLAKRRPLMDDWARFIGV